MATNGRRRFKAHNHPNASFIKRLIAIVYDSLLVLAVWMLVLGVANFINGEAVHGPMATSLLFVSTYVFFAFFWVRKGQTLGMLAWRLRIEDNDGYLINSKQALVRYLGAFVVIGYLSILLRKDNLAWHDIWSTTRIVQLPNRKKTT